MIVVPTMIGAITPVIMLMIVIMVPVISWRSVDLGRIIDMYGDLPYMVTQRRPAMFALGTVAPTAGKMEARKEIRMHRVDEDRIKAAAAATGLQEADFIRQAALLRAQEVEQRLSLSILPVDAFDAFKVAIEAPGRLVPGLARAAAATKGVLKDAG
ncbi:MULTISPECIES: DUF1778 domain-containing protein [unclassified Yoonia]|uniref:type II toxin-antitoxin system TacA family antitoxin n=1 Tax=unclassified Yoonia TaxID=2629118 RepID=UPI002AFEF5F7|nr:MULTISPECIES: DUF1778 domain-containing protein [unclassified Yoonia]